MEGQVRLHFQVHALIRRLPKPAIGPVLHRREDPVCKFCLESLEIHVLTGLVWALCYITFTPQFRVRVAIDEGVDDLVNGKPCWRT
ncbi:hypothetical protein PENSPDRAFT_409058 [Peniophora sp. CONT]|nr:hypothetical protein PENSPDRAFT_409058 [Peniophora sp. CONT]